jgi:zinc and cadmium transporter
MNPFNPIFFALFAGVSTIAGILIVSRNSDVAGRYSHFINSFAAGAILAIAMFHLLPEAAELTKNPFIFVMIGFMAFYILESFLVIHSGAEIHYTHTHRHDAKAKGMTIFSGLLLHSLMDGIIIGVGFEVDYKIGLITSLGVILHEFPEGITSFIVLSKRMDRKKSLLLSTGVAVATPVGALIAVFFLKDLPGPVIGKLLALAGGSFLYITASDLIPETHEKNALLNGASLICGILFTILIAYMLH